MDFTLQNVYNLILYNVKDPVIKYYIRNFSVK